MFLNAGADAGCKTTAAFSLGVMPNLQNVVTDTSPLDFLTPPPFEQRHDILLIAKYKHVTVFNFVSVVPCDRLLTSAR